MASSSDTNTGGRDPVADPIQGFQDWTDKVKALSDQELKAQLGPLAELFCKLIEHPIVAAFVREHYQLPPIAKLDPSVNPQEIVTELYEQEISGQSEQQQIHR